MPQPTPEEMASAQAALKDFLHGMGSGGRTQRPADMPGGEGCGSFAALLHSQAAGTVGEQVPALGWSQAVQRRPIFAPAALHADPLGPLDSTQLYKHRGLATASYAESRMSRAEAASLVGMAGWRLHGKVRGGRLNGCWELEGWLVSAPAWASHLHGRVTRGAAGGGAGGSLQWRQTLGSERLPHCSLFNGIIPICL